MSVRNNSIIKLEQRIMYYLLVRSVRNPLNITPEYRNTLYTDMYTSTVSCTVRIFMNVITECRNTWHTDIDISMVSVSSVSMYCDQEDLSNVNITISTGSPKISQMSSENSNPSNERITSPTTHSMSSTSMHYAVLLPDNPLTTYSTSKSLYSTLKSNTCSMSSTRMHGGVVLLDKTLITQSTRKQLYRTQKMNMFYETAICHHVIITMITKPILSDHGNVNMLMFHVNMLPDITVVTVWMITHKASNKLVKISNGNIVRKVLKIIEWNMGSKHWIRKQSEIQNVVDTQRPDIIFITEANIFSEDPNYSLKIDNYNLELPLTLSNNKLKYARIAVLLKQDLNYELLPQHMEGDISSIWLKIHRKGKKKLIVGGLYREFQYIRQSEADTHADIEDQNDRWRRILIQWMEATAGSESVIVGDCNLDYNLWETPPVRHTNMIENMKSTIGSSGYHQVIVGNTHTWPGARDSLIDHCWVNNPGKVISVINIADASSDHNMVGIVFRIAGIESNSQSFKKRKWGKFDADNFNQKLNEINWDELYQLTDVNLAWDFLRSQLIDILEVVAPIIKCQYRSNHRVWLSPNTKSTMELRDAARLTAKATDLPEDKLEYRRLRNLATREIRKDRSEYYKRQYDDCEKDKNSEKLYKIAKDQIGWRQTGAPVSLVSQGQNITSPKTIAQMQMKYYQDKNTKLLASVSGGEDINPLEVLKLSIRKWSARGNCIPNMSLQTVSSDTIEKHILKLKDSNAWGFDELE